MRKALFVLGLATIAAMSIIVINAQQQDAVQSAAATASDPDTMFIHAFCAHDMSGATAHTSAHHVPAEIAAALELTDAQQAELDRKAVDACAAIARMHEDMLTVLTPEQRAKMIEMHATHGAGNAAGHEGLHAAIMSWIKQLHGAR
jgi:hypothetical protein